MKFLRHTFITQHFYILAFVLSLFSFTMIVGSLLCVFFVIPDDYLQGNLVKIMYIHVPSAWLSISLCFVLAIFAALYLIKSVPFFDIIAKSIAYAAIGMTIVAISTGAIWGKPAWGTWWVWDARLTSMLVSLCMLIGYFAVRNFSDNEERSSKISAIFALMCAVNLPIVKFSVDMWSTLHQPSSILKISGPSIHISMLYPIFSMLLGMSSYCALIILIAVRAEIYLRKTANHV